MVRRMFLPYYSREKGPPRLRMQVVGVRRRRFFKIVAANQRDPRDGKHMEVLGSYVPKAQSGIREIRLRFSRVKFWIGVGAQFNPGMQEVLAWSGLIPAPPALFGGRTKGHYNKLHQFMEEQAKEREKNIHQYFKTAYLQGARAKELIQKEESVEPDVKSDRKGSGLTNVHLLVR